MMPSSLLILAMLSQVPAPPRPGAAAEVPMEGRMINLQGMPENVADARSRQPAISKQNLNAIKELERDLLELYRINGPITPLPPALPVPADRGDDARALLGIIADVPYASLRRTCLGIWNGWRQGLVDSGLAVAEPTAPGTPAPRPASEVAGKVKAAVAQNRRYFAPATTLSAARTDEAFDPGPGLGDQALTFEQRRVFAAQARATQASQSVLRAANAAVPDLQVAWKPLVDHQNARALELVELERRAPNPEHPGLLMLRRRAKIALLERFRADLWMCEVVWAHLASAPTPAPLQPLPPGPGTRPGASREAPAAP
ncbi:hypothetical protein [Mesoterricola silvestris]|uniref:Uncharacterized protein n=1 Tax=Mesoterricola silvestris TaxID=2927979 RepID=A0AA48GFS2_9BACT|nr:hypothetical protein [Mesoterricola silvestris]BDU71891.1 hypothetical protein METEAL_10650 [Mesoterricola silvestris]